MVRDGKIDDGFDDGFGDVVGDGVEELRGDARLLGHVLDLQSDLLRFGILAQVWLIGRAEHGDGNVADVQEQRLGMRQLRLLQRERDQLRVALRGHEKTQPAGFGSSFGDGDHGEQRNDRRDGQWDQWHPPLVQAPERLRQLTVASHHVLNAHHIGDGRVDGRQQQQSVVRPFRRSQADSTFVTA